MGSAAAPKARYGMCGSGASSRRPAQSSSCTTGCAAQRGNGTAMTFDQVDKNQDGVIDPEEWHAATGAPEVMSFTQVDANHDGVISPEEWADAIGKTQKDAAAAYIHCRIQEV